MTNNKIIKKISNSPEESLIIAENIGKNCQGGEIFLLSGDLGAGKTAFCQGLAKGLGVNNKINSPTFNILKLYKVKNTKISLFCHIDAYRLSSGEDLINLGIDEIFSNNKSVTAIEWPEKVKSAWKKEKNLKIIKFKVVSQTKREIEFLNS